MRDLHASMLGAVLGGEGLQGIAELAAVEAGGPVAIVLPARGLADASSPRCAGRASALAGERSRKSRAPERVGRAEVSAASGDRVRARAAASSNGAGRAVDREEVLRAAALAALAEVAVVDARDEVEHELRGEPARGSARRAVDGAEATRRAARLGCDLARGAVALVAEVQSRGRAAPRR